MAVEGPKLGGGKMRSSPPRSCAWPKLVRVAVAMGTGRLLGGGTSPCATRTAERFLLVGFGAGARKKSGMAAVALPGCRQGGRLSMGLVEEGCLTGNFFLGLDFSSGSAGLLDRVFLRSLMALSTTSSPAQGKNYHAFNGMLVSCSYHHLHQPLSPPCLILLSRAVHRLVHIASGLVCIIAYTALRLSVFKKERRNGSNMTSLQTCHHLALPCHWLVDSYLT